MEAQTQTIDDHGNVINASRKQSVNIKISGANNKITIGENSTINGWIWIAGNNNKIEIGDWCLHNGVINVVSGNDCTVIIRDRTTIETDTIIFCQETANLTIGYDCMISSKCFITISDMHPIYDKSTNKRINEAASIDIGDHVWLGLQSYIGKGISIGSNSVVGAHAVLAKSIPSNVVAAGSPARIVRENIEWDRDYNSRSSLAPDKIITTISSPDLDLAYDAGLVLAHAGNENGRSGKLRRCLYRIAHSLLFLRIRSARG